MAAVFDGIDETLQAWIDVQSLFFVATAPLGADGLVNLSPRGHDTFSVLGRYKVGWLDLTGSGIETIAHLRENGRICIMFCSFDTRPRIVRLPGRGRVALPGSSEFDDLVARHPANPSTRAAIIVNISRVSDSCGWGVPIMELVGEREILQAHATRLGPAKMVAYRAERNAVSVDGLPGYPGSAHAEQAPNVPGGKLRGTRG
jgi:hypothetical protein